MPPLVREPDVLLELELSPESDFDVPLELELSPEPDFDVLPESDFDDLPESVLEPELPDDPLFELESEEASESSSSSLEDTFVPLIVIDPMPDVFESKLCVFPFFATVTAEMLLTEMDMASVTVYDCFQGPVICSATSLMPSHLISTQEISPLATETLTTVFSSSPSLLPDESVSLGASDELSDSPLPSPVELPVSRAVVDPAVVCIVFVATVLVSVLLLRTQDPMDMMMMAVSTMVTNTTKRTMFLVSPPKTLTTPPLRSRPRARELCVRAVDRRRLTFGLSTLAMFREDLRPVVVEAASYGLADP